MRRWFRIMMSLLGSVIALWMVRQCNIVEYLPFVPVDKQYDICIAVYFTLSEEIIEMVRERIRSFAEKKKVEVYAAFYLPCENENIASTPILKFNELDMGDVDLKIRVKGNSVLVKCLSIKIGVLKQADIQFSKKGIGTRIDLNGDVFIDLDKICDARSEVDYEGIYKLTFQRADYDSYSTVSIRPELCSKKSIFNKLFIKYNNNHLKIVSEER